METEDKEMVNKAVIQMQDSEIFDHKFIREWEKKARAEQMWMHMKDFRVSGERTTHHSSNMSQA